MNGLSIASRWLTETAGLYRTHDRIVHVRGDDARSWLNGQISNDVRSLGGDEGCYAVTLTVKGRIVSDLWVVEEPPGMAIVLPAAKMAATLERFEQYIIMEDVELASDDTLVVVTVQGPRAAEVVRELPSGVRVVTCARLGTSGFDCWVGRDGLAALESKLSERVASVGGGVLDDATWANSHVELAVPRLGFDFGEDSYPQEAGLRARALSFGKGCYLGQEVVYMLDNRGQVARRLVQLAASAQLTVGAAVQDEQGKRVGEITSVAADDAGQPLALAYVKRALAERDQTVWVAGSPCRVRQLVGVS